jgi:hypothetical protein
MNLFSLETKFVNGIYFGVVLGAMTSFIKYCSQGKVGGNTYIANQEDIKIYPCNMDAGAYKP